MSDPADPNGSRTHRRLPRWREVAPFLKVRAIERDPVERRLARAHTIGDLAEIARRRTPKSVFEYVSGGAEGEIGIERARQGYERVEFRPHVLRDVSSVDTSTSILGRTASLPLILAPTGFTRMMQHEGETAVARAAAAAGVPYALSTMGTATIEAVTSTAPTGANWFQLYLWKDRAASKDLVERAVQAGVDVLVLTVDTPVPGNRLRDVRNGMTIPPTLNVRTLTDMTRHPSWWMNLLTTEPLEFANLTSFEGTVGELVKSMFDPSLGVADLEWLRSEWPGKLVVKGIQDVDDARNVVDAGADALVVSNHGGRQLDRAPTPLELLPQVVDAVGSGTEVYVDTGITTGSDLIAAVGLGATAGMVGRAYLYGLMAGGQRGVTSALDIFQSEATRTMQLMGARSVADVRGRVTLRGAFHGHGRPGGTVDA